MPIPTSPWLRVLPKGWPQLLLLFLLQNCAWKPENDLRHKTTQVLTVGASWLPGLHWNREGEELTAFVTHSLALLVSGSKQNSRGCLKPGSISRNLLDYGKEDKVIELHLQIVWWKRGRKETHNLCVSLNDACPLHSLVFECLVLNWRPCLGNLRKYGLARGGMSLREGFVTFQLCAPCFQRQPPCLLPTILTIMCPNPPGTVSPK